MISNTQILAQIDSANQFIDKNYLESLNEYQVQPLQEHFKKHSLTQLYHIQKIIYDKNENINEKLVSVFHSVMPFCKNLVLIIKGSTTCVDLFLGIRASQRIDATTASDVLHDAFLGNFPGSRMKKLSEEKIPDIFAPTTSYSSDIHEIPNIAYINILPSERSNKQEEYIQGLEKFVDTMRGNEYICEILASPIKDIELESRMNGFEELYSALFPFSKKTSTHGHNQGTTLTEGITESISNSISEGISKATGKSNTHSHSKNSAMNIGMHMLLNFGVSNGTQESLSEAANEQETNTNNLTNIHGEAKQTSESKTTSVTDNLTIEFRDKTIDDLLEKINCHIKRLKTGASYGMWEVASYFMSSKKTTAAMAASTYRSLLLGEESGIEKSNFTLFDSSDKKTAMIEETLSFCEHPSFSIPFYDIACDTGNTEFFTQLLSPSNYISGKELAILFNFPRKSINGVMITEMAEFGRNVLASNQANQRLIDVGQIFHMGQTENAPVMLNLDSFTSHCFITGSTGSGKSNTVYQLIEEVMKAPYQIPFLVIEPAKGEYRNEFRGVPGINLFSTNPQIDQMLKLNPFAFCDGIHILEHLDRLVEIFNGCWEMYAAMPSILKEAIEEAYISKGWDLLNSVFLGNGNPTFPTFNDVLQELPKIINNSDYSSDTKGDYIGALVTRVNSMTNGIYGQIFCDEFGISNSILFDKSTIIDLSRVGSSETKSLLMGFLILKLTEHRMANAKHGNSILKHLTILEEAHNLLKNSKNMQNSANSNVIAKSVEMIVNSIAEMRTYGEGFIIVDQSPTSVDIAAIKNTNTKIIMRLPEEEDCKIVGHSVSLNQQQIEELAKLETGVAVVMQNSWSESVLAHIHSASHPYEGYEKPVTFEELKAFRSAVLSSLIEQYGISDEQDINKVIHKIESFDILRSKKEEMLHMIIPFGKIMARQYNSILFGKTILQVIGCNGAFRKAEKYLHYQKSENHQYVEQYTEESLSTWYQYINEVLPQYVSIPDSYHEIMRQYILHAKKFETHAINYSTLYQQIYPEIK